MSAFTVGQHVRLISSGFAETGRIGIVHFAGSASVMVKFPVFGSSQLLDEWLEPVPEGTETRVFDLRMAGVFFRVLAGELSYTAPSATVSAEHVAWLEANRAEVLAIVARNAWG